MDPLSALGAASSAVGITTFALDLAVGLFKLSSQVRSAKESLHGVGETVNATAFALEEIEKLLLKEEDNVRRGKVLAIFSTAGLARIKETANRCLVVLWKIEAVVCGEQMDEQELEERLLARSSATSSKTISLHPEFNKSALGLWDRVVFAVSTSDKLKEYGRQLQNFQISLSLIFDVVTVAYLLSKSSLTDDDREQIATTKEDLHQSRPDYRRIARDILEGTKVKNSPRQEGGRPKRKFAATHSPKKTNVPESDTVWRAGAMTANVFMAARSVPDVAHFLPGQAAETKTQKAWGSVTTTTLEGFSRELDGDNAAYSRHGSTETSDCSCGSIMGDTADPVRVYTLQRHGDWRKERIPEAEIARQLQMLDQESINVLGKKLSLSVEYQDRIDDILTKVNDDDDDEAKREKLQWNLRQLELKKGRLSRLRGLQAIVVYLQQDAQQRQARRPGPCRQHASQSALSTTLNDRFSRDIKAGKRRRTDGRKVHLDDETEIQESDQYQNEGLAEPVDKATPQSVIGHSDEVPVDAAESEGRGRSPMALRASAWIETSVPESAYMRRQASSRSHNRRSWVLPTSPGGISNHGHPSDPTVLQQEQKQQQQVTSGAHWRQYNNWSSTQPISVRQDPTTTSAFSSRAHPDEDWTKASDLLERKRIQNRIAQPNYRAKIRERMQVLESMAVGEDGKSKKSSKFNGSKKAPNALQHPYTPPANQDVFFPSPNPPSLTPPPFESTLDANMIHRLMVLLTPAREIAQWNM